MALSKPLPGLSLMSVRDSDRCWASYHVEFQLCLINRRSAGVSASYACGRSHIASAGALMAFEPGDHHVTTRVRGGKASFDVVGISSAKLENATRALEIQVPFHFKAASMNCAPIARALERLVAHAASGGARFELECLEAGFLQAVHEHCAESSRRARPRDVVRHAGVRAARDYLQEHFREEPRLDDLAALAGLTRFAFAHAFKRSVGLPPYAYFQLRRICEARKLIELGMPVPIVARELGYNDVPHLTRTLRAHWGAPPGRWRRCLHSNVPVAV